MIKNNFLTILNKEKIQYAIIDGIYSSDSYKCESPSLKADLDVVLKSYSNVLINKLIDNPNFSCIDGHSFIEIDSETRIDLYFSTLNVGYFHFLRIDSTSFDNQIVSESEFIIYQIIDPLLKFSKYHPRHQFRLRKYFKKGISSEVKSLLDFSLGSILSYLLLNKIKNNDFEISKIFIKLCKFRLLFINGNFVKMLNSRIF